MANDPDRTREFFQSNPIRRRAPQKSNPATATVAVTTPLRWVREPDARRYLGHVSVRTWKRWEKKQLVKPLMLDKTKLYDLVALDRVVLKDGKPTGETNNQQGREK